MHDAGGGVVAAAAVAASAQARNQHPLNAAQLQKDASCISSL